MSTTQRFVNAGVVRDQLDREGCAHGQVTRERLNNLVEDMARVETKVNTIMLGVALQLISFVLGVVLFILNHVKL